MNGEAHQVGSTLADVLPPLSPHEADETPVGGDIQDLRIMGIDGEPMDVVELIDRCEPRWGRKTGTAG
jgi:hypothetical protein